MAYRGATGFGIIIGIVLILLGVFYSMPLWWSGACTVLGTFWVITNTIALVGS